MRLTRTKRCEYDFRVYSLSKKTNWASALTIEDEGRQSDSLKKALERRLSPETPEAYDDKEDGHQSNRTLERIQIIDQWPHQHAKCG